MKKIFLLILIASTFSFAQVNTNLNGVVSKKAPVGTILGSTLMITNTVTGEFVMRKVTASDIVVNAGLPFLNSIFVPNGSGMSNTSGTSNILLADGYTLETSNTDSYIVAAYKNSVDGYISEQVFDNNTFDLSKFYQTPTGITVSGTSASFSGIDFGADYSSKYKPHSAVDKTYVDSRPSVSQVIIPPVSFSGNSFTTIPSTKIVAYVVYNNGHVITPPFYDNTLSPTQVTIDIGAVPISNVIVGFFK